MKNGLNKFAKGMFAIFTIKLLFLGIMFLNQSCQNDDNNNLFLDSEKEVALNNFEKIIIETTPKIQKIIEKEKLLLSKKSANFNETKAKTEGETKKALMNLVTNSKELFKLYNVNESDVSEEFEDLNDPRIALVGLMIFAAETKNKEVAFNFSSLLSTPTYAMNEQWDCVMEAIGIPAGMIAGGMKKMTVKAMLKAAGKMAGRALGWVGLAWAVADYTSCMGYW
jgi:hypothetical protein